MIKNYRGITAISSLITALFFLSIVFYGCENQKTIEKITALLNTGDIETARRIAHTLRSNAGYLGKQEWTNLEQQDCSEIAYQKVALSELLQTIRLRLR